MKPGNRARRVVSLWLAAALNLTILVFGEAVRVDFLAPAVSLSEAFESAVWRRDVSAEHRQTLWMLFAWLIAFSVSHSGRVRLGALALGFLTPAFMAGPVMFAIAAISPLVVVSALTGQLDGESYCEGMLQASALGLWMLCCVIWGILETIEIRRSRKQRIAREEDAPASGAMKPTLTANSQSHP